MRSFSLAAILLGLLAACGTKGPLTLPPPETATKPKLAAAPFDNSKPIAEMSR